MGPCNRFEEGIYAKKKYIQPSKSPQTAPVFFVEK